MIYENMMNKYVKTHHNQARVTLASLSTTAAALQPLQVDHIEFV